MLKLIIADMDGTVVDSMPTLSTVGVALLAVAGRREVAEAQQHYDSTVGSPFVEQVCAWAEKLMVGSSIRRIVEAYELVHSTAAPHFPLTEFGQSVVDYRHDLHPELGFAIVSSTKKTIMSNMPQLLRIPWTYIGGYEGVGTDKTYQIKNTMRDRRVTREEVCYVGDSPSDAEIAAFLGIPFFTPSASTIADIEEHFYGSPARMMGA